MDRKSPVLSFPLLALLPSRELLTCRLTICSTAVDLSRRFCELALGIVGGDAHLDVISVVTLLRSVEITGRHWVGVDEWEPTPQNSQALTTLTGPGSRCRVALSGSRMRKVCAALAKNSPPRQFPERVAPRESRKRARTMLNQEED